MSHNQVPVYNTQLVHFPTRKDRRQLWNALIQINKDPNARKE